uniref:Low-density lipoprotein receptor domain class A n=1 Tax=Castor canadensis TaxID=51338 RepID=A0A8C0WXS3_CASCN
MFYKEDSNGLCLFAQLLLVIFSHTASPSCPTLHVFLSRRITLGPSPTTHSTLTCMSREFKCEDGEACIVLSERCDGFLDCLDESDEKACSVIDTC